MQDPLPQQEPDKAKDSLPLPETVSNGSTSTPPSPGFAEFARKVNQLADALKHQGKQYYQVDQYEIMSEIGHGGQGIVFRARDTLLNREVALKVPHLRFMGEPGLSERFMREARSLALLNHPNIVRIQQGGEIQGLPYLVIDYCADGNLTDWLKSHGPSVSPRTAATWIYQLAQGLHYAHQHNILHRDIKPNNVFIQRREEEAPSDDLGLTLMLGDFGLAKTLDAALSEQSLTLPEDRIGTPAYMAPEQVEGQHEKVCPATDIYSMGIMLYELLMGRPLYPLANSLAARRVLPSGDPPCLRKEQPGIPRDLEAICRKCLEHNPAQRYRDGGALAADLSRYLQGEPVPRPRRFWRSLQRNLKRYRVTIVALVCLSLISTTYFVLGRIFATTPLISQITGLPLVKGECREVWTIAFSPDGKLMYIAGDSEDKNSERPVMEHITIYDMEAHRIVKSFPTHLAMIRAMAIVDEGKTLITSSYDGTVVEWDAISGQRLSTQPVMQFPTLNQKGKEVNREINVMAISRNEEWIAVASKESSPEHSMVMVFNRQTKKQYTLQAASHCNVNLLVFPETKNNTQLLLAVNDSRTILRWKFASPNAVLEWTLSERFESILTSPDCRHIALATETHQIKHYLWPSRQQMPVNSGHQDEVRTMVFSKDTSLMASLDVRGTVILWEVKYDTIRELKQYPLKRQVEGLAFSPDGKWLAVGDCNGCVELIPVPRDTQERSISTQSK